MNINRQTYTEYFLLYIDNELDATERVELENFITVHPDLAAELELLKQTTFPADMSIVFNDKSSLYRKEEEERKIVPFGWWKIAAAAILLIAMGTGVWFYMLPGNNAATNPIVAKTNSEKKVSAPVIHPIKPSVTPDANLALTPMNMRKDQVSVKKDIKKLQSTRKPVDDIASTVNNKTENKNIEAAVADNSKTPAHAQPELKTAENADANEDIKNSVASFRPNAEQFASNVQPVEKPVFNTRTDNNLIYFANTSFPRKTKLREVFRKASRVFEKVTSIGSGNDLLRRNDMEVSTQ